MRMTFSIIGTIFVKHSHVSQYTGCLFISCTPVPVPSSLPTPINKKLFSLSPFLLCWYFRLWFIFNSFHSWKPCPSNSQITQLITLISTIYYYNIHYLLAFLIIYRKRNIYSPPFNAYSNYTDAKLRQRKTLFWGHIRTT